MEDVFLAQRAREIYQLDRLPGLRFDFGYLHPDVDRSLTPAARASASLTSLSGMAIQILAWDQIFQQLNTAQIGFDVIHPQLSVAITDPAKLQEFASGASLDFSIDLAEVPDKMFELKVNALSLEMPGATSAKSANIWMTHSGKWRTNRRTRWEPHRLDPAAPFGAVRVQSRGWHAQGEDTGESAVLLGTGAAVFILGPRCSHHASACRWLHPR